MLTYVETVHIDEKRAITSSYFFNSVNYALGARILRMLSSFFC